MSLTTSHALNKNYINFSQEKTSEESTHPTISRSFSSTSTRRIIKKQLTLPSTLKKLGLDYSSIYQKAFLDIESLNEENISLRNKLSEFDNENTLLKNRLIEIDNDEKIRNEETIQNLFRTSSQKTIIPNLKQKLTNLQLKLKQKETEYEELKAKIRNKKVNKTNDQIQNQIKDCQRIRSLLEQAMMKQEISMSSENAEERYKKNLKEIEDLKRYQIDYKIALDIIKNELDSIKGQENIITNIYKQRYYNKRKKLKKITALKNELILLQKETFKQEKTFKNKEAELIQNLEKLIIINEENAIKLSNNERQLYDKKIQIQEIIKENNNIKTVLRRTRTMNG